jgi:hypothetical protein
MRMSIDKTVNFIEILLAELKTSAVNSELG